MRRAIKFRAFDKNGDGMFYNIQNGIEFDDGSHYTFDKFLNPQSDDTHDWIVMQFTGLLDKNGKEIYEFDIVQRGVIVFQNGKFQGQYYGEGGQMYETWEDDLYQERGIEVLGNIYQNPELLNP